MSGDKAVGGNATERALLNYSGAYIGDMPTVADKIEFNSTNKYSAVTIENSNTLIKGAPEKILARCKTCYDEIGKIVEF